MKKRKDAEPFLNTDIKTKPLVPFGFDIKELYNEAHSELSLQQSKRDQVVALYITLFSLLLPISFSIEKLEPYRWFIFLFLCVVGLIFSEIVCRYRVYKEIYWISCITIMNLASYKQEDISKNLIQQIFYHTMFKKGTGIRKNVDVKTKKFRNFNFARKTLVSAETLYFVLVALALSICLGLSLLSFFKYYGFIEALGAWAYIIPVVVGALLLCLLYQHFINRVKSVYKVLIDNKDKSFNSSFEKAWFLFVDEAFETIK